MTTKMDIQSWLAAIRQAQVIAVVRATRREVGFQMARAVAAGGIRFVEVTWNSDRAPALITQLRDELPDCVIGAGTLLTLDDQQQAIAAGAQYLFTPHVDLEMIKFSLAQNIPLIAGALSPTEIITAWQAGAATVKVFPVQAMGGAAYIQSLQGPLGNIPLIPTGGVTLANTRDFLQAGAVAVGLAGDLFPRSAVESANWQEITRRAAMAVRNLHPLA
jgi:2-dehydro-3-deoxyphosphogluconate aldolase / (4S)-4-hydroxy-2-oxoglutarate aldolase